MISSLLFAIVLIVALGAAFAFRSQARKKKKSAHLEALRQRLRHITLYDEAKIERLIGFERDELKRKGHPQESLDRLMTRAIERWERDNASAAPLY